MDSSKSVEDERGLTKKIRLDQWVDEMGERRIVFRPQILESKTGLVLRLRGF